MERFKGTKREIEKEKERHTNRDGKRKKKDGET